MRESLFIFTIENFERGEEQERKGEKERELISSKRKREKTLARIPRRKSKSLGTKIEDKTVQQHRFRGDGSTIFEVVTTINSDRTSMFFEVTCTIFIVDCTGTENEENLQHRNQENQSYCSYV